MDDLRANQSLPRQVSPPHFQPSRWTGYLMAVTFVGLALWSRFLLEPYLHNRIPFATFFVAVALTAWFGGYGPCLVAVALGAIASWYFVLDPRYTFTLEEPFQILGLTAFVFTGLVIATFSGRVRSALRAMYAARQESETRVREAEGLMRALRESERRFRGFAEHTENVLWIIRGDRDELIYVNPAFTRIYGRPTDEIYQDFRRLAEYVHEERESVPALSGTGADRASLSRSTGSCVLTVHGPGSVAVVSPSPMNRADVELRAGISEDISEEKRLQQERNRLLDSERSARQAAERSSKIKDEFLATLSHELRSPLNAILGWVQVLRMRPPTPDVLNQAIEAVERNSQAQARLIEDLLDMSSIVSGKFRLEVQTVDLTPLIRAAAEWFFLPPRQKRSICNRCSIRWWGRSRGTRTDCSR